MTPDDTAQTASTTNNDRRIGWGILSTGHIATVFARDLALLTDEARLVAVGSRTQDKADAFATDYDVERAYGSYTELAADPDVDVIYIASTHNDHFASAKLCLEAGKSVLVEKPLTVTPAETDELIELARGKDLFLMEALWSRTNPLLRQAAALIGAGELGPIRHVAASFGFAFDGDETHRLLDPDQAGGAILDLGVYPVHGVNLFLGEPEGLAGFGTRASTGVDAQAAATLFYPATDARPAATASILCTLEVAVPSRLEVFCAEGTVTIDNFVKPESMDVLRSDRDGKPEVMVTQLPGGGYTFQAQEVMRCLLSGENESPLVPWADTQATMRTLDRWRVAVDATPTDAGLEEHS